MTEAVESKYRFEDTSNGFRILSDHRPAVEVWLTPDHSWKIRRWRGTRDAGDDWDASEVSLYNLPSVVQSVVGILYQDWKPKKWLPNFNAWDWSKAQTARALAKRIKARWEPLVATVPADYRAVAKVVHSTVLSVPARAIQPILFSDPYVISDLLRFHAARFALADIFIETRGYISEVVDERDLLERMRHWRMNYVPPGGVLYPALNSTLSNLPQGMNRHRLITLRDLRLRRPFSDKLELTALLCYASRFRHNDHLHLMMHARHDDIRRAMAIAGRYAHQEFSSRRGDDIYEAVGLITDFPDAHHGSIVGLAQKSVEWHRATAEQRVNLAYAHYQDDTPLALPPIALPTMAGIQFLDTIGAVRREGVAMGHCIGGYAQAALDGDCFLFHADYRGESASVEVTPDGVVAQAQGVQNRPNAAAAWARKQLAAWGRSFPKDVHDDGHSFDRNDEEVVQEFAYDENEEIVF